MMDATMSDRVCAKFKKVVGGNAKTAPANRLKRLRDNEYTISARLNNNLLCGYGYYFSYGRATGYPIISLWIQVYPKAPRREEIISAMKQICVDHQWTGYSLDKPEAYSWISKRASLQHFLSSEDHVVAIEAFFLDRIAEVALLKQEYPTLPWEFVAQESATEEEE